MVAETTTETKARCVMMPSLDSSRREIESRWRILAHATRFFNRDPLKRLTDATVGLELRATVLRFDTSGIAL